VLVALFNSMRPRQWAKNIFCFIPLLFDEKLFSPVPLLRSIAAAAIFALISSSVYLINDLGDVERDKLHPVKRHRPLASGALSPLIAKAAVIAIPLICLPLAWLLHPYFFLIMLLYLVQNIAYTYWLKHVVILDAMSVASGYVLRIAAGALVIDAERFSPWLYLFATFLSLLIAFSKRRNEISLLEEGATEHRAILQEYGADFVDELITIVAASSVISYSLYTFSAPNVPRNHTMMLTIPFVIYGVFRYLYLVRVKHLGGEPEEIFLSDKPLLIDGALYALLILLLMYLGRVGT
jgi:4-hydroxybenzoate polyprenyltransferase